MTTSAGLHAAAFAILDALPTVKAFNANVPEPPPAEASGRVYPYAVIWPSPGGDPFDPALDVRFGGLNWTATVTVAAGDPTWCMQAVDKVRAALTGVWLAADTSPLLDQTPASRTLALDPDVKPSRWFVPLLFGCQIA